MDAEQLKQALLHLERLAVIEQKVDDLRRKVDQMNGSVARHSEWIAAKAAQCDEHLARTEAIHATVAKHRDWIAQAHGGRVASEMVLRAVWALVAAGVSAAATLAATIWMR